MTAYDLIFPDVKFYIANFNIMAHTASKFTIPKDAYVHSTQGETEEQWIERYNTIIKILKSAPLDIFCLEEVTQEFYDLLLQVPYFLETYKLRYSPENKLLLLVKIKICSYLLELSLPAFKYSKLSAHEIFLTNGKYIIVVNAHLIGDPKKRDERRRVLKELFELHPNNLIIIGDFNEDLKPHDIVTLSEHKNFIISTKQHKTAYSRFHINPAGFVTGVKDEQWESIDNIIYDSNVFKFVDNIVFPEGGLHGKHAPYIPLEEKYSFTKNFEYWPSDHTLNIYKMEFTTDK